MNVDSINIKAIKATNLRVDASYHLSEGQEVKRIINSCPYEMLTIKDVSSDIFIGGRAKRVYVTKKEHGIPFLSSSDILQADLENVKLASKKYTPNLEQMKLKKGWTLISRSGTIGNCAFANAKHAQKLASEHVIRVYPNNILRQGLIYAYLTSKYGHSLLTQGTFGAVIQHIEPAFVGSLPIPNFPESFQIEVDNLIQESAKLREEATDALEEAHSLIESEFDNNILSDKKSDRINIKNIINVDMKRFDASFHLAKAMKYENQIKNGNYVLLSELCTTIFGGGRAKRYYTDDKSKAVPYLSNSDLTKANTLRTCKYSLSSKSDSSDLLKKGMIVTGRVGAIGQTQLIGQSFEDMKVMGSDNVIRIVPVTNNGYIFAFLSSKIGNSLFWKYATGGVQPFISSTMVGLISIPVLKDEIIKSCNALIETYISKKELSNIKENEAISMVEAEIEKWNKH